MTENNPNPQFAAFMQKLKDVDRALAVCSDTLESVDNYYAHKSRVVINTLRSLIKADEIGAVIQLSDLCIQICKEKLAAREKEG